MVFFDMRPFIKPIFDKLNKPSNQRKAINRMGTSRTRVKDKKWVKH